MKLQFLKLPRCHVCIEVSRILDEEIKPQFPDIEVEVIDMTSKRGVKMMKNYNIDTSPALFIEGKLFAAGPVNKDKLIEKILELT